MPAPGGAVSGGGVVGNPSLCPAFRVRRGSGRENGFMTGRARRATRPTASVFRLSGDRRLRQPASVLGHRLAVRLALRSPLPAVELREHARSRPGVADGTDSTCRREQGTTESSCRRARPYDTCAAGARPAGSRSANWGSPRQQRARHECGGQLQQVPPLRVDSTQQCRPQRSARSWAIERQRASRRL